MHDEGLLPQLLGHTQCRIDRVVRRLQAFDDFDRRHDRNRIKEVHADHFVGAARRSAQPGNRNAGGVRGQYHLRRAQLIELLQYARLETLNLWHRFDDEFGRGGRLQLGHEVNAVEHLIRMGYADFSAFDSRFNRCPDLRGTCFALRRVDFNDERFDLSRGGTFGNAPSHGSRADHRNFLDRHLFAPKQEVLSRFM